MTPGHRSIYEAEDWWGGSVRGLRQLRKLVPARFRYFETVVEDWSGRVVLDLGCGGGFMAEALARRGAGTVIGMDPCASAIAVAARHARENGLRIDYRVGRGEAIALPDDCVDVVVCVDVLEHVADLDRVLTEVRRVLKPGGVFLFDTVNRTRLAAFVLVTLAERWFRLLPLGTHEPARFIAPDDLRTRLDALAFDVSPFTGLGPVGLHHDGDVRFGRLPTLAILYMGSARLADAHDPATRRAATAVPLLA